MDRRRVLTCLYDIAKCHEQSAEILYDMHDSLVYNNKDKFAVKSKQYGELADKTIRLTEELVKLTK